MRTRSIEPAALAAASLTLASLVVTACGEKSSEQTGTGGAVAFAGNAGIGAAGMGGTAGASATGGAPFVPPPTDAGACRKTDEPCSLTTDCCKGNVCVNNNPVASMNGCKIACTQNSDCPSACCYKFTGGSGAGMCADAPWCSCGGTGAACSATLPGCCNTHQCQGGVCNQKCTQNSECATQCCVPVPLLPGTSTCLERMYCP
jgi:hypothetical protein